MPSLSRPARCFRAPLTLLTYIVGYHYSPSSLRFCALNPGHAPRTHLSAALNSIIKPLMDRRLKFNSTAESGRGHGLLRCCSVSHRILPWKDSGLMFLSESFPPNVSRHSGAT